MNNEPNGEALPWKLIRNETEKRRQENKTRTASDARYLTCPDACGWKFETKFLAVHMTECMTCTLAVKADQGWLEVRLGS